MGVAPMMKPTKGERAEALAEAARVRIIIATRRAVLQVRREAGMGPTFGADESSFMSLASVEEESLRHSRIEELHRTGSTDKRLSKREQDTAAERASGTADWKALLGEGPPS